MATITRLIQRLRAALQIDVPTLEMPAPIETPAAPTPAQQPGGPTWHALPGNVIELADTGFSITLDTSPNRPLYVLRAPEGFAHGWGSDLPGLKRLGERYAAERAEFVCRAQPWKP